MDKTSLLAIIGLGGLAIHFMSKKAGAAESIPEDLVYIPEGMVVPPEKTLETIEVSTQSVSPTVPIKTEVIPVPSITPDIPILIAKPVPIVEAPKVIAPIVPEPKPEEFLPVPIKPKPIPIITPIDIVFAPATKIMLNSLETFKSNAILRKDEFDLVMYDVVQLMIKTSTRTPQLIRSEWIRRIKDLYISGILGTITPALHQSFENMFNSLAPLPIPAIDSFKRMDLQAYQNILTNIALGIARNVTTIYKNSIQKHPTLPITFEGEIRKIFMQNMEQKRKAVATAAQDKVSMSTVVVTPELIDAHGELITVPSLAGLYVLKRDFIPMHPLVLYDKSCPGHYTQVDLRKISTLVQPDLSTITTPELVEGITYLDNLLKAQTSLFATYVKERQERFARFRAKFSVTEAVRLNYFNKFVRQAYIDAGSMVTSNYDYDKAMNNFNTYLTQGKTIAEAVTLTFKPASFETGTLLAWFKTEGSRIHMRYLTLAEQFACILNVLISGDEYRLLNTTNRQAYLPLEDFMPKKEVAIAGDDIILPVGPGATAFYEFEPDPDATAGVVEKRVGGAIQRFYPSPTVYMYYRFLDGTLLGFNLFEIFNEYAYKKMPEVAPLLVKHYIGEVLSKFPTSVSFISKLSTWNMRYEFGRSLAMLSVSKMVYDLRELGIDVSRYTKRR